MTEDTQLWAVVELFGHQVIAGAISKVEPYGTPMIQIDVPAIDAQPAFSKLYNPTAVYGISYVSQEIAVMAAREARHKPVAVYLPDIADINQLLEENKILRRRLNTRGLPEPDYSEDGEDEDDDSSEF